VLSACINVTGLLVVDLSRRSSPDREGALKAGLEKEGGTLASRRTE